jgi:predicted alpha/beta-hydrolase family hydrolase
VTIDDDEVLGRAHAAHLGEHGTCNVGPPEIAEAATMQLVTTVDVATAHGTARAHVHVAARPRAALVLGHGAAGGVGTPDLVAARDAALEEHVSVELVEQTYIVAGRRSPAPARQLDASWTAVVDYLRAGELADLRLVVGGRSLGARVACRTAEATRAVAAVCLAFPVHPPGRPDADRLDELDAVTVPVLVVQGDRDPFGMPPAADGRVVVPVPGDHSLKTDVDSVAAAVRAWLPRVIAESAGTARGARG